ncbi:MAG: hypothetical protein GY769_17170 [bacterium]|nr:hypothetical protein [bacterium]
MSPSGARAAVGARAPPVDRRRRKNRRSRCGARTGGELPELPTLETLRQRARETLAQTPSLDDIVERAREILVDGMLENWQPTAAQAPA